MRGNCASCYCCCCSCCYCCYCCCLLLLLLLLLLFLLFLLLLLLLLFLLYLLFLLLLLLLFLFAVITTVVWEEIVLVVKCCFVELRCFSCYYNDCCMRGNCCSCYCCCCSCCFCCCCSCCCCSCCYCSCCCCCCCCSCCICCCGFGWWMAGVFFSGSSKGLGQFDSDSGGNLDKSQRHWSRRKLPVSLPTARERRVLPHPGGPFEEEHLFFVLFVEKWIAKPEREIERKNCVWSLTPWWFDTNAFEQVAMSERFLNNLTNCTKLFSATSNFIIISNIIRWFFVLTFDCFSLTIIPQCLPQQYSRVLHQFRQSWTPHHPFHHEQEKYHLLVFFGSPHKKKLIEQLWEPQSTNSNLKQPFADTSMTPKEESMAWEKRQKAFQSLLPPNHQKEERESAFRTSLQNIHEHPQHLQVTHPSSFDPLCGNRSLAFCTFFIRQNNKNSLLFFCHKNKTITRSACQTKNRNRFSVQKKISSPCISFLWQQLCVLSCCVLRLGEKHLPVFWHRNILTIPQKQTKKLCFSVLN